MLVRLLIQEPTCSNNQQPNQQHLTIQVNVVRSCFIRKSVCSVQRQMFVSGANISFCALPTYSLRKYAPVKPGDFLDVNIPVKPGDFLEVNILVKPGDFLEVNILVKVGDFLERLLLGILSGLMKGQKFRK